MTTCPTCLHPIHEGRCEAVVSVPYIWPDRWVNHQCECRWTPIKKREETAPDANHA